MKKKKNIYFPAVILIVSISLLVCAASPAQAQMPVYVALDPITTMMSAPTAVALDNYGNVYVTESNKDRLLIFSQSGNYLDMITGLDKPISVAVDDDGRIFIGNKKSGNVEVYNADLTLLFKLGSGDGEITQPNGIAVSGAGGIYVVDKKDNKVKVYNPDGSPDFSFGSPGDGNGEFNNPTSIAIDEFKGELIISDLAKTSCDFAWCFGEKDGARIQVFDMNGGFKRSFDNFYYQNDYTEGLNAKPLGLTVDGQSRIYATDAANQIVHVFESGGTLLGIILDPGSPLRTPLGITVGSTNKLYVASSNTGRVEVYGLDSYEKMNVAPLSVSFEGEEEGSDPALQSIRISNNGSLTLNWTADTNDSWITLSDTSGSAGPAAFSDISIGADLTGLTAGLYTGSVDISAGSGITERINIELTVLSSFSNSPPDADAGAQYSGYEGYAVTLDASGSSDIDGNIAYYEWDIDNDGIYNYGSTSPYQMHIFYQEGSYAIKLRVTDSYGETDGASTSAVILDSGPEADFTGDPTSGEASLTVNFSSVSIGDGPLIYIWDFDNDGNADSNDENPTHIYQDPGTYTVKMVVLDKDGDLFTLMIPDYITVNSGECLKFIKIEGKDEYCNLQDAYIAADDGDIIKSQAGDFTGSLNADLPKSVSLKGGYKTGYEEVEGITTLSGSITTGNGTLTIENFILEY